VIELYNRKSVPENDYDKAVYGLQQITSKYNAHKNALKGMIHHPFTRGTPAKSASRFAPSPSCPPPGTARP